MIVALCLTALIAPSARFDDEAMFARTYKAGEKVVYGVNITDTHGSLDADLVLTVQKLLDGGRAEVRIHLDNFKGKVDTENVPAFIATDVVTKTAAHNLPEKFTIEMGNFNALGFFGMVAGFTLDKKVKVGSEESWTWAGGNMALKAKARVLDVSLATKRLKAEIKATGTNNGSQPLEIDLTSTYDLADGSLAESHGRAFPPGNEAQGFDLKVVRKS